MPKVNWLSEREIEASILAILMNVLFCHDNTNNILSSDIRKKKEL